MPFRENIIDGIKFILSNQNPDGGIAAIKPGDVSGCWSTAEALEIFLKIPFFPKNQLYKAKDMLEFLLKSQKSNEGWPLVFGGKISSTMATGHALSALAMAEKVFPQDTTLLAKIQSAKEQAKSWLNSVQNNEGGGWGVEPSSIHGNESRMISTCYALRGYFDCGMTVENSLDVRRGINYITNIVNSDGGWGGKEGNDSDPDNTSRALIALIRSNEYDLNNNIIIKGRNFILKSKHNWKIDVESYVTEGAPGQTIFHSNTLYDVLEALIYCRYFGREVHDLIQWFVDSQEDDGKWYLSDFDKIDRENLIWSTSEAISVLDISQKEYIKKVFQDYDKKLAKRWKTIIVLFGVIIIGQLFYILGYYSQVFIRWEELPESWKQGIFGVVGALIIGIIANFITPSLFRFFNEMKQRIKD